MTSIFEADAVSAAQILATPVASSWIVKAGDAGLWRNVIRHIVRLGTSRVVILLVEPGQIRTLQMRQGTLGCTPVLRRWRLSVLEFRSFETKSKGAWKIWSPITDYCWSLLQTSPQQDLAALVGLSAEAALLVWVLWLKAAFVPVAGTSNEGVMSCQRLSKRICLPAEQTWVRWKSISTSAHSIPLVTALSSARCLQELVSDILVLHVMLACLFVIALSSAVNLQEIAWNIHAFAWRDTWFTPLEAVRLKIMCLLERNHNERLIPDLFETIRAQHAQISALTPEW